MKTVRARIAELNDELEKFGASIKSRRRYGYTLEVLDRELFESFLSQEKQTVGEIPSTPNERISFILLRFLSSKDYIRLDDLAD